MRDPLRAVFAASFVLFGITASAGIAPAEELIPACDYGTTVECMTKEVDECVERVPCGYSPPAAMKICCKERVTTVEYFYWSNEDEIPDPR
jgi:hypothetical protein